MIRVTIPILALALAAGANAQVLLAGGTYSQDFDTLQRSGSSWAWTDNSTIAGWYMRRMDDVNVELADSYSAGPGSLNSGTVWSFGPTSVSERALGSIASGSVEHMAYGVRLTNNSGGVINSFTLSYTGEQWRDGGNTTAQSLWFSYNIGGTTIGADLQTGAGEANYVADSSYTRVTQLDFNSPNTTGTAGALDGNLAANQTGISHTVVGLNWGVGQDLWFRWVDVNNVGTDHGLGIDNLTFTANPVPEPGTLAALALGAAMLRRRKKA